MSDFESFLSIFFPKVQQDTIIAQIIEITNNKIKIPKTKIVKDDKIICIIIKALIEDIFLIPDIISSNINKYIEIKDEFDINSFSSLF